jgi:hypothetical protein
MKSLQRLAARDAVGDGRMVGSALIRINPGALSSVFRILNNELG